MCSVQCAVCSVQYAVFSVQYVVFSVQCAVYPATMARGRRNSSPHHQSLLQIQAKLTTYILQPTTYNIQPTTYNLQPITQQMGFDDWRKSSHLKDPEEQKYQQQ